MSEERKGGYSQIDSSSNLDGSKQTNVFSPRPSTLGSWCQEGTLFIAGVLMMLAHHSFYSYLNGLPTGSVPVEMRGKSFSVKYQSVASGVGNAIAYVARTVLSTVIGMVFIQVVWWKLRRGQYSIKVIDALLECKAHPFAKSTIPVWTRRDTITLATIASMSSLMALISIIAPGSLQVVTLDVCSSCVVNTVSLNTSNIAIEAQASDGCFSFTGTQPPILKLAGRVLMAGAPLSPKNPCVGDCSYQITFDAPMVNCTDVNPDLNLTSWIPPPANSSSPIPVWDANAINAGSYFIAASKNLENDSITAVNCTSYKANYTVDVSHINTTASTARVVRAVPYALTWTSSSSSEEDEKIAAQYASITTAFANTLKGRVEIDPSSGSIFVGDNVLVGMSPALSGSTKLSWSPTSDLGTVISSFMQNISISLLADQLSDEGDAPTAPFKTECHTPTPAFQYQPLHLLTVYGAALGVTLVCMLIGARAKRLNGVEESFSFSRIVGAVLNDSLFSGREELTESSELTATGSATGQLQLVDVASQDGERL